VSHFGYSHDYKRNGTTTLFAAYEVSFALWSVRATPIVLVMPRRRGSSRLP
jgi:hypothetical protein